MQSGQTVVLAPLRDIHCRALLLQRLQLRERQLRGCCPLLLKGSPEIPAILAAIASHKRPTQAYFRPPTVLTPLCIGHGRARSGCYGRQWLASDDREAQWRLKATDAAAVKAWRGGWRPHYTTVLQCLALCNVRAQHKCEKT